MRMVVTVPLTSVYGKEMRAGDQFECTEKEARLWSALARAKQVTENIAVKNQSDGKPETQADPEPRRRGRQSGSYMRRDLRAEE